MYTEYSPQFFLDLIPAFKSASLPFHPIVDEFEIRDAIANMHNSAEDCSFVHAFGALVMNHENGYDCMQHLRALCTRAIESRPCPTPESMHISVKRLTTCIWIQNCMHTFLRFDLAFFYLREAISMLYILRIDDPATMAKLPPRERARRQRLYWQTFIHERYLGIMNYQPVILKPLQVLPDYDDSLPPGVNEGFNRIIQLFIFVDEDFIQNWQQFRTGGSSVTAGWFETKHRQLDEELFSEDIYSPSSRLSDMQLADITVTRQWLRTLIWQMTMSKCLLSSSATKDCMSLLFPLQLSQQLRHMIGRISRDAIHVNGYGILQKMFEVTDAIADVVIHVPAASPDEARVRVDHFLYLCTFLVAFPRFVPTQKRILQEKMDVIRDMFPDLGGAYFDAGGAFMADTHMLPPIR